MADDRTTATGWGAAVLEELQHYEELCFVTAITRSGREFLCPRDEFAVMYGWPAVWRLDNRMVPESEIVSVEISGERSDA